MSLLKRLFGSADRSAKPRVRVCVECGMPVADHKEWCSILRGEAEMREKRQAASPSPKSAFQD
jgi:hypothetical protein